MNNNDKISQMKSAIRKAVEDKRKIHAYVKEHGTLDGFHDPDIRFASVL